MESINWRFKRRTKKQGVSAFYGNNKSQLELSRAIIKQKR